MLPLLPPTFLGMGVVGDGLFDTGFFLVGVAVVVVVLLLTGVDLLSPVLDPGGDFRPAVIVGLFTPVGDALPDEGGETAGFLIGLEVTEVLLGLDPVVVVLLLTGVDLLSPVLDFACEL